jgi:ABC-2 type transport system ATP-binding protein
LRERAGPAFEAVVLRCLAKSPEDRWQTADDLAQELETLVAPAGEASNGKRTKWRLGLSRRRTEAPWDGVFPLQATGVTKGFGFRKTVLSGLDLDIPRGAVYALMGRNGSGKTTLIRTCLGLYRRDGGRVAVFGRDPEREGPAILARVGLVPDALAVDEKMKVGELLKFVSRFYTQWDQAHCYRLLARYDLPLEQKIRDLSRGMKTKISLVMALAHRPELLILDDPTLGLDAVILEEFVESLEEAAREGATILIASHNYSELERIATHVGMFKDGLLLLSESVANLKARTCEVRLTFRDDVPDLGAVPDFHVLRTSGRHVTGVILDHRNGSLDRLRRLIPQDLEVRELSLRDIFVHFLR